MDLGWSVVIVMSLSGAAGWIAAKVHTEAETARRDAEHQAANLRRTMKGRWQ
jgi:hypothetical protein